MNEIDHMDRILSCREPYNFGSMGNCAENRMRSEYSWQDFFMNMNDAPFQTDTAVIVTAWAGQLGWLKSSLASYRATGAYVVLSYDNPNSAWDNLDDPENVMVRMPRPVHTLMAHAFVMKHKTYDADKRIGWFWDVRYALSVIRYFPNIKYVYCTNGDCMFERPEGLKEIKELLGDGDLISGQSEPGRTIHTACVLYRVEALKKIMDYMTSRMKFTVIAGVSPECMLRDAVDLHGLKEVFAPDQPKDSNGDIDFYCAEGGDSTWKRVLGFRNLYAEQEYRTNNRLELLNPKYLDSFNNWCYFNPAEREMMCRYYDTMDRRWLYMWWDRNCNSIEERAYHPLEYYGKEPIPEDGSKWA